MNETFTLYKLIILYMLDKVDFPMTTSQISEFILDQAVFPVYHPELHKIGRASCRERVCLYV